MPLVRSPISEADMPAFTTISRTAFATAELHQLLYLSEPTAEQHAFDSARMLKVLHDDTTVRFLKVTDTSTGEMVACAKWHIYETPKSREKWEKEARERLSHFSPGANVALQTEFLTLLYENRIKYISDKPCIFLHILTTHPSHHRRGAGSLLLQWGSNEADRLGFEIYLEASPVAVPLYIRFGFEQVDEILVDMRPHGGSGIEHQAVMVRKPRPRN